VLFTVASLACGLASDIAWLIVFRALQGIGAAAIMPCTMAIVVRAFPENQRGLAIGFNGGIGGLGIVAGPVLGGLLVFGDNWRWIFLVNLPLGLVCIGLTLLFVEEYHDHHASRKMDWPGMFTLSAGLFAVLWAFTMAGGRGVDLTVLSLLCGGVAILVVFGFIERYSPHPLIELSLFRNPHMMLPCVSLFLFSAALFGSQPFWSMFMQNYWGFTPLQGGLAFIPATGLIALLTPWTGILSQKSGARLPFVVITGVILIGLSFIYVSWIQIGSHFADGLLPALLLRGIGIPVLMSSVSLLIMNSVVKAKAGLAAGMLNMSRNIGTAAGVTVLGQFYLFDAHKYLSEFQSAVGPERFADSQRSVEQFRLSGDMALKTTEAAAIVKGFSDLAILCALAFIPALFSALFIRVGRK